MAGTAENARREDALSISGSLDPTFSVTETGPAATTTLGVGVAGERGVVSLDIPFQTTVYRQLRLFLRINPICS